jgi:PPOX class probable F420-dependent enzyme
MAAAPPVPDAWIRLTRARVARLATVGPDLTPRLVPCCLALDGMVAFSAVDDKPKRSVRLSRLADVARHPVASLLVDHYGEDWHELWWVRASGPAHELADQAERDRAVRLLLSKYPQYLAHQLDGPVLAIHLERWRSWAAS